MEAMERRGNLVLLAAIIMFWCQYGTVEGHRDSTKMSYVCPPQFIRLGHSCYFFSEKQATWQNALFACKDRESNLSVPARWEDRNLRAYLNKHLVDSASRWIGGIYEYGSQSWKWGGELRQMHYQSFSKMKKLSPDELQWHCIAMMPELLYRWAPKNCFEPRKFICQTKLRKVPKSKVKELRRRWQRMGQLNEITAPSVSREVNDRNNDVTVHPYRNPKSYDLRPNSLRLHPKGNRTRTAINRNRPKNYRTRQNELKKRSRPPGAHRRLKRPFEGYQWKRSDPEGSYKYNVDLLKSGKTGLTPQQIKTHLARLARMRDVQIAKRRRLQLRGKNDDWLVNEPRPVLAQTHARTYMVDNNISALHPKTIVEEFDLLPASPSPVVLPSQVLGR
ncbi:uncharacterized protein LOC116413606 [Galleria mellonella]|uniref:Uncharacterized protein LOC116413606 n=1 Tax=Galleria mellonella TaxID=7137 RepID=A0ABM3MG59_GALME|nr:uncharacterized protein LOC116413606 [Galleria mellonella]XP_052750393.1 uncharacterized protein LOC116413606 [Galleria mellonella]XP_052750394.1 uncharacterized protein LOC116413606 [Galleria mellonella]